MDSILPPKPKRNTVILRDYLAEHDDTFRELQAIRAEVCLTVMLDVCDIVLAANQYLAILGLEQSQRRHTLSTAAPTRRHCK